MNILFWNIQKKNLHNAIFDIVEEYDINLVMIAENFEEPTDLSLLEKLRYLGPFWKFEQRNFKKIDIYTNSSIDSILYYKEDNRYAVYAISLSNRQNIIICAVHFPSKLNWNHEDYSSHCNRLKRDIEEIENKFITHNTIIIGDFNMNPFEGGIVSASGLHNTSIKEVAMQEKRKIQGEEFKFFYNPMWSFFGEDSKGDVCGTHFFNTSKYINFYWNMYDQIMFRPSLIDKFNQEKCKIITEIKGTSLTEKINGITRLNDKFSDHLPITSSFNL